MERFEDIIYLTCFIKYIDDDLVGKLISNIYSIKNFYNPYDSNMELFLNLILYENYPLDLGNYSFEDLYIAKKECVELSYDKEDILDKLLSDPFYKPPEEIRVDKIIEKRGISYAKNNLYLILDNALQNHKFVYKGKEVEYIEDVTNINDLLPIFNNIFISFNKDKRDLFINQVILIMKTIFCFDAKISNSEYRNFINSALDFILINGFLYVIEQNRVYCYFINTNKIKSSRIKCLGIRRLIEAGGKLYLYDIHSEKKQVIKHKTSIRDEKKHSLLCIKSIKSFIQSYTSLDTAWEELDKIRRQKNKNDNKICPICSPLVNKKERNTKQNHKKIQMCDNCKKIFKEIRDIAPEYTTERIRTMIKLRSDKERTLSAKVLKEKHYEKLNKLLRNINEKCDAKRMEDLQTLVNTTFQIK